MNRYNFFVLAYGEGDYRIIIRTNDEKRADSILAALNHGRVYMQASDGDFEYFIVNATGIGGQTDAEILATYTTKGTKA